MAATTTVRIVLGSDVRLVDLAHEAAEKVASLGGFEEDDALNFGIAVREAVINAIVHGNRSNPARKVDVLLTASARGAKARVRDQGAGFDPGATADPTAGDNVLRTSGRGLLMVRAFVDAVDFKYRDGRGMDVTMTKGRAAGRKTTAMAGTRP